MAKKKSSNAFWIIIGVLVVAIGAVLLLSMGGGASDIDFSAYNYTDPEVTNEDAEHVLVEYSDFQCPYCAQTYPVLKAVKQDLDVRVEYKHFPLNSIHPYAQLAAEATECARDQDRFWAYHDMLFDTQLPTSNPGALAKGYLIDYAEGLGLDATRFKACLDNREKQPVVAQHLLEGQRAGVQGTPTLFLDGERVNYRTFEQFKAALE